MELNFTQMSVCKERVSDEEIYKTENGVTFGLNVFRATETGSLMYGVRMFSEKQSRITPLYDNIFEAKQCAENIAQELSS